MRKDQNFKRILLAFKIIFMMYLLLAFNAFVNGTVWMNAASYAMTAWGLALIIWMGIRNRRYRGTVGIVVLLAFIVSYLLSAGRFLSYGVTENLKGAVWLVISIVLFYVSAADMGREEIKRELKLLAVIYIWYCTLANIISITMLYWGRFFDYTDKLGSVHAIGFRWGRLWGIYDDPNHGATITVTAVFLAVYLLKLSEQRWKKTVCIATMIFNVLYIYFSDSRTGLLALCTGILLWIIFRGIFNLRLQGREVSVKRVAVFACAGILAAGVVFAGDYGLKVIYKPMDKKLLEIWEARNGDILSQKKASGIGRKKDIQYDYSNGRISIWEGGIQIVESSPVTGVGYRNMLPYAKDKQPDNFIALSGYDSMHNLEMDILVSQGIIGILLFAALVGRIGAVFFRRLRHVPADAIEETACCISITGALAVASTFLSIIFYVNTPQGGCFWLFLGYLLNILSEEKEGKAF